MEHNLNTTQEIESKTKLNIHSDTKCDATKKTDDSHSTSNKESVTYDMENLYWHTHGSGHWQR